MTTPTQAELLEDFDPSWHVYSFAGNIPQLILAWQASGNNNDFSLYPHFGVSDNQDIVIFTTKTKQLKDYTPTDSFLKLVTEIKR